MLYSMSRDKKLDYEDALKQYRTNVRKSFELYLFNLLHLVRVAQYARQDAAIRAAKLRPTDEDLQFSAKLGENELIRSIDKNEGFNRLIKHYKFDEQFDEDKLRQIYVEFAETDEYKAYLANAEPSEEDHRQILLSLYKHCTDSEMFTDVIEDNFPLWVDDESLIVGAIKKTIKALPAEEDFYEDYRPQAETTVDFGEVLFKNVFEQDKELLEIIEPTLKNWDAERVAVMDMILLKMAISELLTFPTIPTKVTLNEFVEISKMYSTDKSKDFINGILDRLLKKLEKEGKIEKKGRGLKD